MTSENESHRLSNTCYDVGIFCLALSVCVQTFSITDPDVQRREIDSICVFFVMIGVVSFITQMLQVHSALTRLIASGLLPVPPCLCSRMGESHKRPLLFC